MSLGSLPNILGGGASTSNGQLANGTLYGLNQQTITGNSSGAWAITANGSNQNVTLTPSGTGTVSVGGNVVGQSATDAQWQIQKGAATNFATLNFYNLADNKTWAIGYRTTAAAGADTFSIYSSTLGANAVTINSNGRVMIGSTTDSGALLQIGTNTTTSAGGSIFGTDTAYYRIGSGAIAIDHIGGTNPAFQFREGGAAKGALQSSGGNMALDCVSGTLTLLTDSAQSLFLKTNNTAAMTLDSSQNCLHSTGANGQSLNIKHLTELTTIAAAATTDTTIQMPANSIVLSVAVRVVTVIPTATSFSVGDSGLATRFSTANVGVSAGSTDVGTKAGAYYNASALSVRLTMNGGTPATATGQVRVTIAYLDVTVPTS